MRLSPRFRRFLERLRIIRPRRGRQDVWAAFDRGGMPGGQTPPPAPASMVAETVHATGTLSAKIIRADGTVEDLGVIATLTGRKVN